MVVQQQVGVPADELQDDVESIPDELPGLQIEDREFDDPLVFKGVTFAGPVKLKNVKFRAGCAFRDCKFKDQFTAENVQVHRGGPNAIFSGCTFFGTVRFRKSCRLYGADFSGARFRKSAYFNGSRFQISANFQGAKFSERASFDRAIFEGKADFSNCIIDGAALFQRVDFKYYLSHAVFTDTKFNDAATFYYAHFGGDARFNDATFKQGARFERARFATSDSANADEDGHDAAKEANTGGLSVDFSHAKFLNGGTNAEDDDYTVLADFGYVTIGDRQNRRDVTFSKVTLGQNRLQLDSPFQFRFDSAKIYGEVTFEDLEIGPQTQVNLEFKGTRFSDTVNFSGMKLDGDLSFEATQFGDEILLHHAQFSTFPDFRDATYARPPDLHTVAFPSPGRIHDAVEKDETLKRIAALRRMTTRAGDRRTDSDLHVAELQIEGGVASQIFGFIADYGRSWFRPALCLFVLVFAIFPAMYLAIYRPQIPEVSQVVSLVDTGGPACKSGGGAALVAAVELSVNNAMFFAPSTETRGQSLIACLGRLPTAGIRSILALLLETLQIIATFVFAFLVGFGVRNRLRMT